MYPTPFALIVIVAALLSSGEGMLRTLMVCCLFGATAAIALPALGGAPITPAVLLLPFLAWRAMGEGGVPGVVRQVSFPQAGFWLLLLVLWGVLSAYFLPRLFLGETMVRASERGTVQGVRLIWLQPLTTNFTQAAYAVAGLLAFVCVRCLLEAPGRLAALCDAVLLAAGVNCAAALLNLAELHLHLPTPLALLRNAGYAIMVGGDVGGLQRISGTFAESSAFSAFTLPLFAFTASLWSDGVRRKRAGWTALALLALLLVSTSSTAYAGLVVYGALLAAGACLRTLVAPGVWRIGPIAGFLWLVAVVACVAVLVRPELLDRVLGFFEVTLVRKLESSSGIERSSWNQQAWINFRETFGVGIGLGSARASSFPLVLLSNLGVIGALLFSVFAAHLFFGKRAALPQAPDEVAVVRAARRAVLAALVAASISAGMFDLGLAFFAYAAAAATRREVPQPQPVTGGRHARA